MNVEEQVATLEALLARVKKNAAMPRALHRADVGASHVRGPAAAGSAGAPAAEPVGFEPATLDIAPRPVEPTPQPAPVEIAAKAPEAVVERPQRGLATTLIGTPGMSKLVAEAAAAKAPAVVPKPVEKVEPVKAAVRPVAPTVGRPAPPKPDAGTPRTPAVAPAAPTRAAAPRAPLPSRPPIETAAPVAEHVETAAPAEPIHVAPPVAEIAKVEPVAVKAASTTLKPPDENELLFNFDTEPEATAKRAEPKAAVEKAIEKPVEKAVEKPVAKRSPVAEEEELTDEETKLMVGPIPDAARPPPGEEVTVDDDTRIVSPPEGLRSAAKTPVPALPIVPVHAAAEDEEPEPEEVTRLMEPTKADGDRISAPKIEGDRASAPKVEVPKVVLERSPAPRIEGEKVVVSAAARPPVALAEPAASAPQAQPVEPLPSVAAEEPALEPRELTSPSRRIEPAPEEALPVAKPGSRAPLWGFAIAATLLIGAGIVVGLRNGWFDGGPSPSGTLPPPGSALPTVKDTTTSTGGATTTATAALSAPELGSAAPGDSAAPALSASAGPAASASAAPATSASAGPDASGEPPKPPPDGDGSALPPNKGYLIIKSAKSAGVFLTGTYVGMTGEKLEVDCGAKFLRLGVAPSPDNPRPAEVTWISEGKSAAVTCRATTTITLEAK